MIKYKCIDERFREFYELVRWFQLCLLLFEWWVFILSVFSVLSYLLSTRILIWVFVKLITLIVYVLYIDENFTNFVIFLKNLLVPYPMFVSSTFKNFIGSPWISLFFKLFTLSFFSLHSTPLLSPYLLICLYLSFSYLIFSASVIESSVVSMFSYEFSK